MAELAPGSAWISATPAMPPAMSTLATMRAAAGDEQRVAGREIARVQRRRQHAEARVRRRLGKAVHGDVDVGVDVRVDLEAAVGAILIPAAADGHAAEPGDAGARDRGQVGARVRHGRRRLRRGPGAVPDHVEAVDHRRVDEVLLVEQLARADEEVAVDVVVLVDLDAHAGRDRLRLVRGVLQRRDLLRLPLARDRRSKGRSATRCP